MAGDLKFQISEEEGLYYLCSKNKGADQSHHKLICYFVFTHAKSRFSYDAAHMIIIVISPYKTHCCTELLKSTTQTDFLIMRLH